MEQVVQDEDILKLLESFRYDLENDLSSHTALRGANRIAFVLGYIEALQDIKNFVKTHPAIDVDGWKQYDEALDSEWYV